MKQFVCAALSVAAVQAAGKSACLFCRDRDRNSGILVSWSYCAHQDICLENAWNYIQRDCLGGWEKGADLSLNYCEPTEVTCPSFTSSPEKYQKTEDTTWSIAAGSKCTVQIDATGGIARVTFQEGQEFLGFEVYREPGKVYTFESGSTDIILYNAAETGPITFTVSFSGASALLTSAAALATLSLLSF